MENETKPKEALRQKIYGWAETVGLAVVIAVVLNCFVIVNAVVPTGSMMSTINVGDRVIANRLAYLFGDIERGDIVIFEAPDDPELLYVKRVIGLPGDTVVIKNKVVTVNGQPLQEDYIFEETLGGFGPYNVPEGHYFCLGDNRNNSADARYWKNTYVPKENIKGKVFVRYYPQFTFYGDTEYH